MTDQQKQGELTEIINNVVRQNNKLLLEEIAKLLNSHSERLEKSNVDNGLLNSESLTSILQKLNIMESAIGEKKKTIKTTTVKPAETTGEEGSGAAATGSSAAAAPAAKKPANKMAYFKARMLVDTDYYNSVAKKVDAILKGKSQELENAPAVLAKKPTERKKAICAEFWALIGKGKELKPVLDDIEKEYKDLKTSAVPDPKQTVGAQLDKDKQSDEE